MIPARIISIDDKVMVEWYNLPEPSAKIYTMPIYYDKALKAYLASKTIAEVENVILIPWLKTWKPSAFFEGKNHPIKLNQTVFIEPTETGKCKIIKI
jgi:hypothetical protein